MAPQGSATRGLLSVSAAVLFFGLAGVLGKMTGLPAAMIVFGRVAFASAALAAYVAIRRPPFRPHSRRDLAVLVGQGALLALHWTAFFQSINVSSVAIGLLSFSSFPLFTAAFEPILTRKMPDLLQIVAALLVLPGVVLLVPTFSIQNATTAGVLWGLLAGATFAVLSVVNRWLGREYSSVVISLYQDGIAALVLLPVAFVLGASHPLGPREVALLAVLGLLCTALAHTLFIAGLRSITAQLASLIATLEPVWGIVFALVLLGEVPNLRTLAGGCIIIVATLLPALARLNLSLRARATEKPARVE